MRPVSIVGWSGSGKFEDLERTALRKLAARGGDTTRIGDALLVDADDPVAVARDLAFLPGVAWIAVGYRFSGGMDGYLKVLEVIAERYLSTKGKGKRKDNRKKRSKKTFRIFAQVTGSQQTAGDAVLAGNSALLSTGGARVDERRPDVRFRVCIQGASGGCGAEIRAGPGGAPSRGDWVSCLVSGGERSSSMAWMAALSGFSLTLLHSRTDEVALRHVARLYSELSFRMDPRCLELVVLGGDDEPFGRIGRWLKDRKGATFVGLRGDRPDAQIGLAERFPNLFMPLVLVQDDSIHAIYASLGLGRVATGPMAAAEGGLALEGLEASRSPFSESRFGGVQADSNAVIDAVKRSGRL